MWAVGLRGAVAYGLAVNLPQINEESKQGMEAIESATLVIVVISTIVFGGLTGERILYAFHDIQSRERQGNIRVFMRKTSLFFTFQLVFRMPRNFFIAVLVRETLPPSMCRPLLAFLLSLSSAAAQKHEQPCDDSACTSAS